MCPRSCRLAEVRAVVVTSAERTELLPNVPTMREVGFPEFEAMNWGGSVVPAATPTTAVNRLNSELVRILNTSEIQDKFRKQGQTAVPRRRSSSARCSSRRARVTRTPSRPLASVRNDAMRLIVVCIATDAIADTAPMIETTNTSVVYVPVRELGVRAYA